MTVFDWRNYLESISWWQAEYELHDSCLLCFQQEESTEPSLLLSFIFGAHYTNLVYVVIQWLSNVQHLQSHGL